MASRKIEDCIPELQKKYILFREHMTRAGLDFIITCTKRFQSEQEVLYAQGRTTPGKIVTWTLNSKHLQGRAFDIAMLKNGKLTWDEKDYKSAGEIGREINLKWGGDFKKNKDYPHFEI